MLVRLLVLALLAPSFTLAAPAAPYLGVNVMGVYDYEPTNHFADAMRQSRRWGKWNSLTDSQSASVNADGWPTEDAGTIVQYLQASDAGTWKLSWTGTGTPFVQGASLANVTASTADVLVGSGGGRLDVGFTGTSGGVTNVKLMRPIAPGSTTAHSTSELWNRAFLARVAHFQVIRVMDMVEANNNPQVDWADRTLPRHASQQRKQGGGWCVGGVSSPCVGLPALGVAWELVVRLANDSGKDVWINTPHKATDTYLTKLAQLFKYGADANGNPYTSVQGSPVWPPLAVGRRVYLEYSNEVWNPQFGQAQDSYATADAIIAAGRVDPTICWDGCPGPMNRYYIAWRVSAQRALEVSNLWRSVWGDSYMGPVVRPVLGVGVGQGGNTGTQLAQVEHSGAASHYFYAAAGAYYYGNCSASNCALNDDTPRPLWAACGQPGITVDGVFAGIRAQQDDYPIKYITADVTWALGSGLIPVAYEGGLDTFAAASAGNSTLCGTTIQADARMRAATSHHYDVLWKAGVQLVNQYTLIGAQGDGYVWGLSGDVTNESTQRWLGLKDVEASQLPAITAGVAVPGTLNPQDITVDGGGYTIGTVRALSTGGFALYGFRSAAASHTFTTTVTNGSVRLLVDGALVSTCTAGPCSGSVALTAGLHVLRMEPTFSSAAYDAVSVTSGGVALINVSVDPLSATLPAWQVQSFTCTATYSDSSTANCTTSASWTSSAPSIATVGASTGVASTVSAGTATIQVAYGGRTATASLTVQAPEEPPSLVPVFPAFMFNGAP